MKLRVGRVILKIIVAGSIMTACADKDTVDKLSTNNILKPPSTKSGEVDAVEDLRNRNEQERAREDRKENPPRIKSDIGYVEDEQLRRDKNLTIDDETSADAGIFPLLGTHYLKKSNNAMVKGGRADHQVHQDGTYEVGASVDVSVVFGTQTKFFKEKITLGPEYTRSETFSQNGRQLNIQGATINIHTDPDDDTKGILTIKNSEGVESTVFLDITRKYVAISSIKIRGPVKEIRSTIEAEFGP